MSGDGVKTPDRRKGKKWYKSRTLWINAIGGALGAAEVAGRGAVSPELYLGMVVLNGLLRGVTQNKLEK